VDPRPGDRDAECDADRAEFHSAGKEDRGTRAQALRHQRFAVRARDGPSAGPRHHAGQPGGRAAERGGNLPGHADSNPERATYDHLRDFHLLVGRHRRDLRRRAGRARARRGQGARAARLGRQPEDGSARPRCDARGGRPDRKIPSVELVLPRPREQPHAPQVAGGGRPRRLHRRRRHRRSMARPRGGSRALARHALPRRRPGRRPPAGDRFSTTGPRCRARYCTDRTTSRR